MKEVYIYVTLVLFLFSGTLNANDRNTRWKGGSDDTDFSSQSFNDSDDSLKVPELDMDLSQKIAPAFEKAKQDLRKVEDLYNHGKYSQSLRESKDLLDQIKAKTGVNPKSKYREKIYVKGVFTRGSRNELKTNYKDLKNQQKDALLKAVYNHRGGFYLDLLNLHKRTTLIYIKSFYKRIKEQSHLRKKDIAKIRKDLTLIHDIPLLVKDKNLKSSFMFFDSDVADSDQQYFFNRELVDFILSIEELNVTEEDFDKDLIALKKVTLEKHRDGQAPEPMTSADIAAEKKQLQEMKENRMAYKREEQRRYNNMGCYEKALYRGLESYEAEEVCESKSLLEMIGINF